MSVWYGTCHTKQTGLPACEKKAKTNTEPPVGLEPATYALQKRRSTN